MSHDSLPPIAWLDRVAIMLEDIARIRVFIGEMDRDTFIRDDKTAFAVSYAFACLTPPRMIWMHWRRGCGNW